jgi:hypothetical protein
VDGKDPNAIFNVSSATASSKRLSAADAREALSLKGGDKVAFQLLKKLVHRVKTRRHTAVGQLADFQGGPNRTGSYDEHIRSIRKE